MRTIIALWFICLTYNITTANAASPTFDTPTSSGGSGSIQENKTVGSVIITLQATDTDGDSLDFTVVSQMPATPVFTVNNDDELTVPSGLDYETTKSFMLKLGVTDGTNTATAMYTLTITNVDDESPVFSPKTYTATILDSVLAGTSVTTVTATDADTGSFTYSIQGAQTTFAISPQGKITVSNPSGLSSLGSSVTLKIEANDGTNAVGTATVTIKIKASPCNSSPCQNGGTCTNTGTTTFSCACLSGYAGTLCESVDRCSPNPCNGVKCNSLTNTYVCVKPCDTCGDGFNCTDNKQGYCLLNRKCDAIKKRCDCWCFNIGRCELDICILIVLPVGLVLIGIIIVTIKRYNLWREKKGVERGCASFLWWCKGGPICRHLCKSSDNRPSNASTGTGQKTHNKQPEQLEMPQNQKSTKAQQNTTDKEKTKSAKSKRKKKRKNKVTPDIFEDDRRDILPAINHPEVLQPSRLFPLEGGKPPVDHTSPRKLPPIPSEN